MKVPFGDVYFESGRKNKITRTIEIISSRFSGENKQYLLSSTDIYNDGSSKTKLKKISAEEFKTHIKTGNWHKISASHATLPFDNSVMVQITEHFPLRLPPNRTILVKSEDANTDEEFSSIKRKG